MKVVLWYYRWCDNNYIEDVKSPVIEVNEKNIIFLNFITSIRSNNVSKSMDIINDVGLAIDYISKNIDDFSIIIEGFKEENDIEDDIFDIFDNEILFGLIEYMDMYDYVPSEYWEYDAVSDVNPDGLANGNGIISFEVV